MQIIVCDSWVWCPGSSFDDFKTLIDRLFPAATCDKMRSRRSRGDYCFSLAHKNLGQGRLATWTKDGNGFINRELYTSAAADYAARVWARTVVVPETL